MLHLAAPARVGPSARRAQAGVVEAARLTLSETSAFREVSGRERSNRGIENGTDRC
jgi:hypothetical protein